MSREFELIRKYFQREYGRQDIVVENGDDCAVVIPPEHHRLAVTTDTLIEGVHFLKDTAPHLVAYKALTVNLSDLAAMGAVPKWFTLALTIPEVDEGWLKDFSQGLFELADPHKVALLGGDTSKGTLSITITAMGTLPENGGVLRSGARAGDDIYVTGTLGAAALGLQVLQSKVSLLDPHEYICKERLEKPQARIMAGMALSPYASSMIDCSDGFAADLGHILKASGVSASVKLESLPLTDAVKTHLENTGDWSLPLAGGDDYELIFTASQAHRETIASLLEIIDCSISWVGNIEEGDTGLHVQNSSGESIDLMSEGYSHF